MQFRFRFSLNMVEGLPVQLYSQLTEKQKKKQNPKDEREIERLQEKADKLEKSIQG